jgi:hypothetical protein
MRQFNKLKLLICEDGKFCDATMNSLLVITFGGIMINSISTLT